MATIEKDKWYKIKDGVEYSTNLDFFVKNQIVVIQSGHSYKFCSALESKCFKFLTVIFHYREFSGSDIRKICVKIHKEILEGKYGSGTLID